MEQQQSYGYDISGFDDVTHALMDMINRFPGLEENERFAFSTIPSEEGLAVIPSNGSFIEEHHVSVTDHVWEVCAYPFTVLYKASGLNEKRKMNVKEWMDTLAKWLARQTIVIDDSPYRLGRWPFLSGDRRIKEIIQNTPAYLASINEDKSENWVMTMTIKYHNEYDIEEGDVTR